MAASTLTARLPRVLGQAKRSVDDSIVEDLVRSHRLLVSFDDVVLGVGDPLYLHAPAADGEGALVGGLAYGEVGRSEVRGRSLVGGITTVLGRLKVEEIESVTMRTCHMTSQQECNVCVMLSLEYSCSSIQ